jgi:hypothetical protein
MGFNSGFKGLNKKVTKGSKKYKTKKTVINRNENNRQFTIKNEWRVLPVTT